MRITRIELLNFGSYYGKNLLDFSSANENQRVVVIGGKNGAGKTTLFSAIQIGLYGNFAFGFKSAGHHYLKFVYSLINNQARIDESATSHVEITFEHITNAERLEYRIKRMWSWVDNKVSENLLVVRNNEVLSGDELTNFQNYLVHLIPPDLLKLYFFDGEKIADYFLGDQTINIQNAIMILSGNDTFEIIANNVRRTMSSSPAGVTHVGTEYFSQKADYEACLMREKDVTCRIASVREEIDRLKSELQHMQETYSAKGGISLDTWRELNNQLKEEEEKRERLNWQRKSVATDVLPFMIVRDKLERIQPQINAEKSFVAYQALKSKLNTERFENSISAIVKEMGGEDKALTHQITEAIKTTLLDEDWTDFSVLFGLSSEDERQVLSVIERVMRCEPNVMQKYKRRIVASISRSKAVREKLQNSNIDSYEEFSKCRADKQGELQQLEGDLILLQSEEESLHDEITRKASLLANAKKQFEDSLRKESIADIAGRVALLIDDLQCYLFDSMITAVEQDLNKKFRQLIRKKDFFDRISIDRAWNVHIIHNEAIAVRDLRNLLEKRDFKAVEGKLGAAAVAELCKRFSTEKIDTLRHRLISCPEEKLVLPVELEKDRMSSGEKQIFVMSLYWALMQQSHSILPFVIDTPFARIDTEHRKNITENFFMQLPGQLFVLSTDEEISQEHLQIMHDQIARVYMLDYGVDRKTHITSNQYFGGKYGI